MPNNIKKTLNDFIRQVKELLGDRVKKIILYGSYARGDFNKNSDIDIMILTDLNEKEIEDYRDKISDIVGGIEHGHRFIYWNHSCCTFNDNSSFSNNS